MSAALDHVLKTDQANALAEARASRPRSTRVRTTARVGFIILGSWLFIAPPGWLLPAAPVIPLPQPTVRNLAVELVGQAEEVVAHYRGQGALPGTLPGLDPAIGEFQYLTTGPTSFVIRSSIGDTTLLLPVTIVGSDEPSYQVTSAIGPIR